MLEFGHVLLTVAVVLVAAAFVIAFGHPRRTRPRRRRAHA
jgi:low temperature requirement protein LtrA